VYKVDLHTHSTASPDGRLSVKDYRRALETQLLDVIAVTDHNDIRFAQSLQQALGDQIIVGEEVNTSDGELVGLYLTQRLEPGLTALETADAIHAQGGLVYIPHPFERARKGLQATTLSTLSKKIDIIETYNGRAWLRANSSHKAGQWAAQYGLSTASSSDAHGKHGFGNTYSLLAELPSRTKLVTLLRQAPQVTDSVGPMGLLYPKLNLLIKRGH